MDRRRIGPLKLRAQLLCGEELAMGPGKAALLEAIAHDGSISAAGRALGMSYRRTWLLVDAMNRCWSLPLVEAKAGGGATKGAQLTPMGRQVLDAYRSLERDLATAADGEALRTLASLLATQPRPSQRSAEPDAA